MPPSSRRRFLRTIAAGSLVGAAGCQSDGPATRSPTTDGRTPRPTDGTGTGPGGEETPTPEPAVDPLDGSWESYRHGAANTAATADPGPGRAGEPGELWRRATATDAVPATAPAAAGDAFVVVMASGDPYALEAADGGIRWVADRQASADVDPVASDGVAVVADGPTLVGLDVETGEERWTRALEAAPAGLAADGGSVVAAVGSAVVAVAVDDGSEQWRRGVDGTVATTPGPGDGTVVVGLASGEALAFDAGSGDERWRASVGGEPVVRPAVADGRAFVADERGLAALDATDGERLWRVEPGDRTAGYEVAAAPVATADAVYLVAVTPDAPVPRDDGSTSGSGTPTPPPTDTEGFAARVVALAPADGRTRWRSNVRGTYNFTSGPPDASLAVAGSYGGDGRGDGGDATGEASRVIVGVGGRLHAFEADDGAAAWSTDAATTAAATAGGVVSTGGVGVAVADGSVRWRFEVGSDVASSPAVVGNVVYVGSDDYHCYALAANSGALVWRARTGGRVRSSPAVGDDAVYVGSEDGRLYALDRADGTALWTVDVDSPVTASPTLAGGSVYVGSRAGVLLAVDTDGSRRWRRGFGDARFEKGTPAVADGTVYVAAGGALHALAAADGTERWRVDFDASDTENAVPVVAGGRVFVNPDETVYALDPADGTELWSRGVDGSTLPAPAVGDGTVYSSAGKVVRAFDAETGAERWRTRAGLDAAIVAGEAAVYLRSYGSAILALSHDDGSPLWRREGVNARGSPAVAGEYLVVGDADGAVRALGPVPE